MPKQLSILILLLGLISFSTSHARGHWTIGGAAGISNFQGDTQTGSSYVDNDRTDTGFKFFIGRDFNRYIALELGYSDLGNVLTTTTSYPAWGSEVQTPSTFKLNIDGIHLNFITRFPIGRVVSLVGEFGAYKWSSEYDASLYYTEYDYSLDEYVERHVQYTYNNDDIGLSTAFGIDFNIGRKMVIGGRYEFYIIDKVLSSSSNVSGDSDFAQVRLKIKF